MKVSKNLNSLYTLLSTYDGVSAIGNFNSLVILQKIMFSFESIYSDKITVALTKHGREEISFEVKRKNTDKFRTITFTLNGINNISRASMSAFDHICMEFDLCPIPYVCKGDRTTLTPYILPFPEIKDVIFQEPATIVLWNDGTKTVVRSQCGEKYDPEKGLAMAISKKALGNTREYYHKFLHWEKKYKKSQEYLNNLKYKKHRTESVTLMSDGHSVVQINKESED